MSVDPDATGVLRPLQCGAWSGARDDRMRPHWVEEAIAAHEAAREVLKDDARSRVTASAAGPLPVVVKEVRKAGLRRRLADCVRGTPARRAFRAGRGMIERGIGAALPLAVLERRRFGVPERSLLVSLDLRRDPTAAEWLARRPERRDWLLAALADLLLALHERGVDHGDLRTQHAHLGSDESGGPRLRLVDLESVRFRALGEALRVRDWVQLHASVPDEHATRAQRFAALERYAARLPFSRANEVVFGEIEQRSIARGHRFSGAPGATGGA